MSIDGGPKSFKSIHGSSIANPRVNLIIRAGEITLHLRMNRARLNLTLATDGGSPISP